MPPRLTGLILLLGSGGTTMVHRSIWESARHGPAQAAEFGIALVTFVLASVGMLLLVHGARLFGRDAAALMPGDPRRGRNSLFVGMRPAGPGGSGLDTRHGVARLQALNAIKTARDRSRTLLPLADGKR